MSPGTGASLGPTEAPALLLDVGDAHASTTELVICALDTLRQPGALDGPAAVALLLDALAYLAVAERAARTLGRGLAGLPSGASSSQITRALGALADRG